MGPQKKKDLMSTAFEGFWQSDLTIPGPKINTPRLKSSEDDAFDSFWGRGQYTPVKSAPVILPRPQVVRQPVQSQQIATQEPPLTQAQRYQLIKQRMNLQQRLYSQRQKLYYKQNKVGKGITSVIKGVATGAVAASDRGLSKTRPWVMNRLEGNKSYQKIENWQAKKAGLKEHIKKRRQEELNEIHDAPTVAYKKLKTDLEKGKEMAKARYNKKYNN